MSKNKRYFWIKLKTDFFNSAEMDFLLSQKDGCQYIVLYQMLCLQTANQEGVLANKIGEIIAPFDIPKIARDTKYFSVDTVRVALELYKKLGLVYVEDGTDILRIAKFDEIVGSETDKAKKMRDLRQHRKEEQETLEENEGNNVTQMLPECSQEDKEGNNVTQTLPKCSKNVTQDIEIDIDKEIDKENFIFKGDYYYNRATPKTNVPPQNKKIFDYYEKNFGNMNAVIEKYLNQLLEKYSPELMIYAMDKTLLNATPPNFNYLVKTLDNLEKAGISTIEEAEKQDEKFHTQTNVSSKKTNKEAKIVDFSNILNSNFQDEDVKNAMYNFIKMRKTIKKPLDEISLKILIKKLYKLSTNVDEQIEIIENSTAACYPTFFPLKKEIKPTQGSFDDWEQIIKDAAAWDKEHERSKENE